MSTKKKNSREVRKVQFVVLSKEMLLCCEFTTCQVSCAHKYDDVSGPEKNEKENRYDKLDLSFFVD